MSGNSEIKSIIDRILRLKEEQDAIGDDVREVYAEAKSRGWNKTAIGQAVSIIRKKAKDSEKFEANDSDTDMYLSAYFGHGTDVATHAHEGRVDAKLVETVAQAVQTDAGRKALGIAIDAMIEAEDPGKPPPKPKGDDLEIPDKLRRF